MSIPQIQKLRSRVKCQKTHGFKGGRQLALDPSVDTPREADVTRREVDSLPGPPSGPPPTLAPPA